MWYILAKHRKKLCTTVDTILLESAVEIQKWINHIVKYHLTPPNQDENSSFGKVSL